MEKPLIPYDKLLDEIYEQWLKSKDTVGDLQLITAEAQRDADVAYYESLIQQAKAEVAREIFEAYDAYIKLLGEEIDTLAPLAIAHGWRSIREEAGQQCREKIEGLKAKYIK